MKKIYIFLIILVLSIPTIILSTNYKKSNYSILVDVEYNKLYLLDNNKLIKTYNISSGKYSTPSPIGTFKIIQKSTWGEGFGGAWMGLNVPWGQFGIHGTLEPNKIGYSVSHGCIRLKNEDAKELYQLVPYGTKVVISGNSFGAFHYGLRVLKSGDIGSDVYQIQKLLKSNGFYYGYPNGKFDSNMSAAVKRFQKANNLPINYQIGYFDYQKLGVLLMD